MPYRLPVGTAVRHALEEYVREAEHYAGCQHVYSPMLGKRGLYEISGHWAHYHEDMFPPMTVGSEQVLLRPSLCPHHCVIYRSRPCSHRELPLRIAELGVMFREKASGVLGGLTRVRAIQLNDAHIFCQPRQVATEVGAGLDLIERAYAALGSCAHLYRLSLRGRGAKYVDDPTIWQLGEQAAERGPARPGPDLSGRAGGGRVLRPEDRRADPGLGQARIDPVHRAAGLPHAAPVRPVLPRRRPKPAAASDDPPQRIGSLEQLVAHLTEVYAAPSQRGWPRSRSSSCPLTISRAQ